MSARSRMAAEPNKHQRATSMTNDPSASFASATTPKPCFRPYSAWRARPVKVNVTL